MQDPLLAEMVALIPKMRAYALILTRSSADADDVVQDTMLRAWRFRERFEPGTNLKAWLFRILRNEFLSRTAVTGRTVQDVDGKAAAALTIEADQELKVRYGELLGALDRLSPDTRDAILLTAGSGFTYDEAAELCGCAVGTVKSRVNRAREILARELDPA